MTFSLIFPGSRHLDRTVDTEVAVDLGNCLRDAGINVGCELTVILPMHNVRPYLKRCLDSVCRQIGIDTQIIMVNDGSTDDSLEMAINYLAGSGRLNDVIVNQANKGLSAARNLGVRLATSEYLAFLDTDDFMAPNAYAKMLALAKQENLDMVLCRSMTFDSNHLRFDAFYDARIWDKLLDGQSHLITDVRKNPDILRLEPNANTRLMRRTFVLEHGLLYPEGLLFEDLPVHVHGVLKAERIGLLNARLYMYRINRPGKITDQKSRRRFDVLSIVQRTLDISLGSPLSDDQAACILFALVRISYWCGTETRLEDRKLFFRQLSEIFSSIPERWVDSFAKRYRDDIRMLIQLYAIKDAKIEYIFRISLGMRPLAKTALLFIEKRRYGLVLFQCYYYAKRYLSHSLNKVKWCHMHKSIPPKLAIESLANTQKEHNPPGPHRDSVLRASIRRDIDHLKNDLFSHRLFSPSPDSIVLDVGAETGLLAAYLAAIDRNLEVLVVEGPSGLLTDSDRYSQHSKYPNIHIVRSIDDALEKASGLCRNAKKRIALFKLGIHEDPISSIQKIARHYEIGHLCGEFDSHQVEACTLYRVSKNVADSFVWYDRPHESIMSGYGKMEAEVSIVVPVYNVQKYLPECVRSLVDQTLSSKEILLIDDGSTDSSGELCDRYAQTYPEVRVIHQKNAGCAATRSAGLRMARGTFVGFVDSDDWVDPEMFERLFEAAVTTNADVAQCGFKKVYSQDRVVEPYREEFSFSNVVHGIGIIDDPKRLMHSMPSIWRRIYRTDFLRAKSIDFVHSLPRFDDHPFQFEVLMHAGKVAVTPGHYYNYRLGRVGQDVSVTDERLFVHFDIFDYLRKQIANHPHLDMERELKKVEISTHAWGEMLIEPRLKRKYRQRATADIFDKRLFIKRSSIIRDAFKVSPAFGKSVLLAFIWHLITPKKNTNSGGDRCES